MNWGGSIQIHNFSYIAFYPVSLSHKAQREAMLEALLTFRSGVREEAVRELDLSRVASQTEGYVVRDLEQVVDRALHARRMARNNTGKTIIFITLIRTIMIPHKEGWSVSKCCGGSTEQVIKVCQSSNVKQNCAFFNLGIIGTFLYHESFIFEKEFFRAIFMIRRNPWNFVRERGVRYAPNLNVFSNHFFKNKFLFKFPSEIRPTHSVKLILCLQMAAVARAHSLTLTFRVRCAASLL